MCVCVADLPLCLRDTLIMNICIHESSNLFGNLPPSRPLYWKLNWMVMEVNECPVLTLVTRLVLEVGAYYY